ncbi:hypothetical protein JHW43_009148 [Diplocarpon mali]|nr:hypothetical protein JHW43_009148 [Diplocarpon mali]
MSDSDAPRRVLHEKSPSHNNELGRIRLVPSTPPRLLGRDDLDDIYSRTPLPTHPSHFLGPGKGKNKGLAREPEPEQGSRTPVLDERFQQTTRVQPPPSSSGSSVSRTHPTPQHRDSPGATSPTGSPSSSKARAWPKKRLQIHNDNKTFVLLPVQDDSPSVEDGSRSPTSLLSTSQYSSDLPPLNVAYAEDRSNSTKLCALKASPTNIPATPASQNKLSISADHITSSPGDYQLVGGLRKVPKTPDLKHRAATSSESPLLPLPQTTDGPSSAVSHTLSTKPSFRSTETATTTSENTNYKVYLDDSTSTSEVALAQQQSSSGGSNYQVIGESSPPGSVIYCPQTAPSEDNYESQGDLSPGDSYVDHLQATGYSQESLVLPPNSKTRSRGSDENTLAYYKSRSRESLRTGSFTSITTAFSQQEAFRAIVGSGVKFMCGASKFSPTAVTHERAPASMELTAVDCALCVRGRDRPQLTFVVEREWQEEQRVPESSESSRSPASENWLFRLANEGREVSQSYNSSSVSSLSMGEDHDEYGDVITDMQDLRARPSRTRLGGYIGNPPSDHRRTNTVHSTTSSRANSMLANSLPTWARLYYGSGERRFLLAPGSSAGGTDTRNNSFSSGSPNTDHFPASIYSPRRRPREGSRGGSMEITPATEARFRKDQTTGRFRTWSMTSRWSPHLRLDRRAARRSVWEAPAVNWSTEGGWFGRRNVQVVMFIVGFIFPFAWMIAAVWPLPPKPVLNMREQDNSTSNLDSSNEMPNDYARQFGPVGELTYESAKWWRRLNRWMSFIGLLVIAAVIVLVIIGLKESW